MRSFLENSRSLYTLKFFGQAVKNGKDPVEYLHNLDSGCLG